MLQKYATCEVLEAAIPSSPRGLMRNAHRAVFNYEPREGYLYVRSRAISSRCNDNYDYFGAEEIKGNGTTKGYVTFTGKPVFVNHKNEDHRRNRGIIIDAVLHEDHNPNGSPDTWAEVLMEIDAKTFPRLAHAIVAGHIDRTSMGVDVERSQCSACGNVATVPSEYCRHVPGMKGKKFQSVDYKTGVKRAQLIYEKCAGLAFFENSLLVEEPADATAFLLDRPVLGPGLEHLHASLPRTASKTAQAVDPRIFDIPEDAFPGVPRIERPSVHEASAQVTTKVASGGVCPVCRGEDTLTFQGARECFECGHAWRTAAVDPNALAVEGSKSDEFFDKHPPKADHVVEKFLDAYHKSPETHSAGMHWYSDSHNVAKAIGKGDAAKAAGLMGIYSAGTPVAPNYHYASRAIIHNIAIGGKANPLSGEHSDFHGNPNANATQAEQARRVLDGEHHSKVLHSPKVSNYAHLIEHGDDEPGVEKERVVVDRHAVSAAIGRRITDKEFSSLNLSTNQTRVDYEKDKHGKRVRDKNGDYVKRTVNDYGQDMNSRYQRLADVYREATHRLRDMGHDVKAHQVQAVAWAVQKQRNDAEDEAHVDSGGPQSGNIKGRQKSMTQQRDAWEKHYDTHHDNQGMPKDPRKHWGIRRKLAYGEQKAPTDVDTLRDEACPVCGEDSAAWDGNQCVVCGYQAPPKMFRDPDLDMARQVDLRKDVLDPTGQNPDGIGVGDFADEERGVPGLACPACGATFPAGEPQTTDTADPTAGDRGQGPAEGDVCPECGEGELVQQDAVDPELGLDGPPQEPGQEGLDMGEEQDGQGPPPVDPSQFEQDPEEDEEEPEKGQPGPPQGGEDGSDEEDEDDEGEGFPPGKGKGKGKPQAVTK